MRFFVSCILMAIIGLAVAVPVDNNSAKEKSDSLNDVNVQGHENIGDREARQYGYNNGYRQGYNGYGGNNGGYGGYRGYRGGYSNFGDNRGGYGGYGGYPGSFYG